ncbi:dispanin subfamily A member 2b-like [Malurus melanocephalus]|uniref:dispanin subfamily A member 2b-like n=1 Tax=Malurus melanocephalus TaxID=175006 RepID=UPI0025482DCC|nr:dispanin subfamily A member 2b-like [Malurus melanocephalus]
METRQADVSIPLQSSGWGAAAPGHQSDPQPRDYVLWSVLNVLLWCALGGLGCLSFPALVFSIKTRDCKVAGDLEGARRHSHHAKVANIVCSVLFTVALVIFIIIAAIVISSIRVT